MPEKTITLISVLRKSSEEAIVLAEGKNPGFTYSDALCIYSFCPSSVWDIADSWVQALQESDQEASHV